MIPVGISGVSDSSVWDMKIHGGSCLKFECSTFCSVLAMAMDSGDLLNLDTGVMESQGKPKAFCDQSVLFYCSKTSKTKTNPVQQMVIDSVSLMFTNS